jgi:hypothetical protein
MGILREHVGEIDLPELTRRKKRVDTLEEAVVILGCHDVSIQQAHA